MLSFCNMSVKLWLGGAGIDCLRHLRQRSAVEFPDDQAALIDLPLTGARVAPGLTGPNTYFEDFAPGDIIVHANGRTITEEHMALTYAVGNSHPLHFDRVFSSALSGKMSGEPIVYGGLVFAWLEGLS